MTRHAGAFALASMLAVAATAIGEARSPVPVGTLATGPLDGITDVPGVRVGQVTKIEGSGKLIPGTGPVRTGATGILPNADPWNRPVAAAEFDLNGNGELTGAHYIDQTGYLKTPIVLTDTLDVARADDGVISWLIARHPGIGIDDDVPLPVVAECDDQFINDMQGRHVSPADVMTMLDRASTGDFDRGNAGAGTGMATFGFKGGIGSSSRVLPASEGGYTVGVLVNDNTGSQPTADLRIAGVPVGMLISGIPLKVRHRNDPAKHGADGSIIVIVATDAPLDAIRLRDLAKRAVMGMGRTGLTSNVSSGDMIVAFSTTHAFTTDGVPAPGPPVESDEDRIDALFRATVDATESAIDDAIFSARTMTGRDGVTLYNLPYDRVKPLLPK